VKRSHAITNRANGRQWHVGWWRRWQWHRCNSVNGGLDNNQLKGSSNCDGNSGGGGCGTCGNGGGSSGRSRDQQW
jgi:hypothetical protein